MAAKPQVTIASVHSKFWFASILSVFILAAMNHPISIGSVSGGTLLPTEQERVRLEERRRVVGRYGFLAFQTIFVMLPFAVPALWDFVAIKFGLQRHIYLARSPENQSFFIQMAVCVSALSYCAWRIITPPGGLCRNSLTYLATGFFIVQIISAFKASSPSFALSELMMPGAGFVAFLLMTTMEFGRREIEKLYFCGVVGVLLLAAYAVAQSQGWEFLPYSRFVGEVSTEELAEKQRVSSLFGHPNYMASYLAPMIFWCLFFALSRFPRWIRIVAAAAALAVILAMVLGGTRGGWVAVAGGFIPYYILIALLPKFRRLLLFAATVAVLVGLAVLLIPNPLITVQFDVGERIAGSSEISARFYYWMMALQMLKQNLLLGVGYGHFNVHFWQTVDAFQQGADSEFFRYILQEGIRGVLPGFVHNDWLQIATESGLLGFAFWAAIWAVLLSQMWEGGRMVHLAARPLLMSATFFASFITMGIDGVFNFPLHIPVSNYLFWSSLGAWVVFRAEIAPGKTGYMAKPPKPSRTEGMISGVPRMRFKTQPSRKEHI